jgi:pre-rRNA-processing protein IPI1
MYLSSQPNHNLNKGIALIQEHLIPHSPLLILFTTSAQTHIFPEIRIDAIRFLDLFLEVIPDALVECWTERSGHGNRILEGYLGILNAGIKFGETDGRFTFYVSLDVTQTAV